MSRFGDQVSGRRQAWRKLLIDGTDWLSHLIVPLFWNQSGYSLKPPPLISPDRTHAQNLDALRRHFQKTVSQYGPLVRRQVYVLSQLSLIIYYTDDCKPSRAAREGSSGH